MSNLMKLCGGSVRHFSRNCCALSKKSSTYYEDLEVSVNSTNETIKKAYFKLSKIHHPDLGTGNKESAEKFNLITEAYRILSNPKLRSQYDKGKLGKVSTVAQQETIKHEVEGADFLAKRTQFKKLTKTNSPLRANLPIEDYVAAIRTEGFLYIQENMTKVPGSIIKEPMKIESQ